MIDEMGWVDSDMPIFDIFSKRETRRNPPDVVIFDSFPEPLRNQLVRVLVRTIGSQTQPTWSFIANALRDEWGTQSLSRNPGNDTEDVLKTIISEQDIPRVIDVVELCLRVIDSKCRDERWVHNVYGYHNIGSPEQSPTSAIDECNTRMREAGVGYRYIEGVIIRADSEFGHQENVVEPLRLLVESKFQGAEKEFLTAHTKYRHGDYAGAMLEATKSLESTLKTICSKNGWTDPIRKKDPQRATLKALVSYVVTTKELIPPRSQNFFSGLVKTLEDGAGPLRNQPGSAHGAGVQPLPMKSYEAAYCLGIAGAAIRLLVDAHNDPSRS